MTGSVSAQRRVSAPRASLSALAGAFCFKPSGGGSLITLRAARWGEARCFARRKPASPAVSNAKAEPASTARASSGSRKGTLLPTVVAGGNGRGLTPTPPPKRGGEFSGRLEG